MTKSYQKESPETIQKLFNSIASRYDTANSLMSFHMHALWNNRLAKELINRSHPTTILDLCAGTGEIAKRLNSYCKKQENTTPDIHLVDFSAEMLHVAKSSCKNGQFSFHERDAQDLHFQNELFDIASVAYGIRNVKDTKKCFQEVHRVLKSGGWFGILELTRPKNPLIQAFHKLYLHTALPVIGRCFCANKEAYNYLSNSIQSFVSPQTLADLLKETGFESISIKSLSFGIATLILAKKR